MKKKVAKKKTASKQIKPTYETTIVGQTEVTENLKDGLIDEIIVKDKKGGYLFHLEKMNDNEYWLAIHGKKSMTLEIKAKKAIKFKKVLY